MSTTLTRLVKKLDYLHTDLVLSLEKAEATLELNNVYCPNTVENAFNGLDEVKQLLDIFQYFLLSPNHPSIYEYTENNAENFESMFTDLTSAMESFKNALTDLFKFLNAVKHQKDLIARLKVSYKELTDNAETTVNRVRSLMKTRGIK